MKLKNPMLVVTDIDKSVAFYKKVFGLRVTMDFGPKTLTGGLVLQTIETYKDFIWESYISFGAITLKFTSKKIILMNLRIS